jgi:hypothetical protein
MGSAAKFSDLQQRLPEAEAYRNELMARAVEHNCYLWLTEYTKTKDEQDAVNPYKPFPQKPYIQPILKVLEVESPVFFEKSRTMLISWTVSGWAAHKGFTRPAIQVIFQSEDEDRAVNDVNYVKELWKNSPDSLRDRWKLNKSVELQPQESFSLANGSEFIALVGNPKKIRSFHPTIYVLDEAAHVEQAEESWNTALATNAPHMIALSSAAPGWYFDRIEGAIPVDWPSYAI